VDFVEDRVAIPRMKFVKKNGCVSGIGAPTEEENHIREVSLPDECVSVSFT
jgi:hypothetical protein